jgi:hypothetical protein
MGIFRGFIPKDGRKPGNFKIPVIKRRGKDNIIPILRTYLRIFLGDTCLYLVCVNIFFNKIRYHCKCNLIWMDAIKNNNNPSQ